MRSREEPAPFLWHLRVLMAAAGMFKTSDLVEPLRAAGIELSREQVFRLVTKPPVRLNIEVLAALCRILGCTPADLIEVSLELTGAVRRTDAATGSDGPSVGALRPIPARLHRPTRD